MGHAELLAGRKVAQKQQRAWSGPQLRERCQQCIAAREERAVTAAVGSSCSEATFEGHSRVNLIMLHMWGARAHEESAQSGPHQP